jgi:hypothetical protein
MFLGVQVMAGFVLILAIFAGNFAWAGERATVGAEQRKFHPGHYVALDMSDDGPAAIRDALRPGVQGVEKRYTWRQLEVRKDVYDLSAITADLAVVRSAGRQLVVFVFDKSFKDERFTPEYLWDGYTLPIRSATVGKGYIAKRWDPYVVARLSKLVAEIGRNFDTDEHFEGVALQESALGIVDSVLDREGYTPALYRDALIQTLSNARLALPTSQVFWYMNYLARGQGQLHSVCSAAAAYGVVLGGPDALPDSAALRRHVYPLMSKRNNVTLFIAAQNESFRHPHMRGDGATRYWTPQEIFVFARDELHVQYLFWNRVTHAKPAGSYDIDDAYPVMAAQPRFNEEIPLPRPPAR